MEWIIIDDGTDLLKIWSQITQIKYFKYTEKVPLGRKRNIMHEKVRRNYCIYG